jgi:hypothetical protein
MFCKFTRLPNESGMLPFSRLLLSCLLADPSETQRQTGRILLYKSTKEVMLPRQAGIGPESEFTYRNLRTDVRLCASKHGRSTYKCNNEVRLQIDSGIGPVSWLVFR